MLIFGHVGQRDTSPFTLAEASVESPESSVEGSKEAAQKREALLDRCPDTISPRIFDETLALKVITRNHF